MDLMNWANFWDKYRIRISQAGGLCLIWAAHPIFSLFYWIGLGLVALGEALRIWAAGHIRKGDALARRGPYAMVRHPLYVGSFALSSGFALMCTSWRYWISSIFLWAAILGTFYWLYGAKIRLEEEDLAKLFGKEFEDYRRRVPALWPAWNLWPEAQRSSFFSWERAKRNREGQTLWACIALAVFLRFKMIYGR